MILKVFKGFWFLSMLAVLANLLYVYASLPEQVSIMVEGEEPYWVGKEQFFYVALAVIAITNVLVYLFSKNLTPDIDFRTWIHGLVITLNLFFIVGMSFINLYNSSEKFDFARIGFIIYASVGLVVLWAIGWPVYQIFRKSSAQQKI